MTTTALRPADRSAAAEMPKARGYWRDFWRRFSRNKMAVVSVLIVGAMFFTGIFTEELSPYCHTKQDLRAVEQWPSLAHPLGTDRVGRDLLSRMIWGARTASIVSVATIVLQLAIALPLGLAAGYFGGKVDTVISRLGDFLLAFPEFLFILFFAATIRPSVLEGIKSVGSGLGLQRGVNCAADYVAFADFIVVIFALSFIGWPGLARLVRGMVLSLREREYVEAARAMGAKDWQIMLKHVFPNALPAIIVSISFAMGGAILAETTLSFIGIGIQPPNASWGNTLNDNYTFWRTQTWMVLAPGAVIATVIAAFSFLGDGLNEALNPKSSN
jgi:peptide/nickel transport system permease protein